MQQINKFVYTNKGVVFNMCLKVRGKYVDVQSMSDASGECMYLVQLACAANLQTKLIWHVAYITLFSLCQNTF